MLNSKIMAFWNLFTEKDVLNTQRAFFAMLSFFLVVQFHHLYLENLYYEYLNPLPMAEILSMTKVGQVPFVIILSLLIIISLYLSFKKGNTFLYCLALALYFFYSTDYTSKFAAVESERFFHSRLSVIYGLLLFINYSFFKKIKPYLLIIPMHLTLAITYVGPTYERLKLHGFPGWYNGETMQSNLLTYWLVNDNSLALYLAQNDFILTISPMLTFVWEATFILSVFIPSLLPFYLFGAVIFHALVEASMEVNFAFYFMCLFACFFNKTYYQHMVGSMKSWKFLVTKTT